MSNLLVIGCASLDTIHIETKGSRKTYQTIGGAGLYTALAARMSISVTLFAPKPNPMPKELEAIEKLLDWQGPTCDVNSLPRLEIVHHGNGRATLLNASWGAESQLSPEDLPALDGTDVVHIAALHSARAQLTFMQKCREFPDTRVSVGTYARLIAQEKPAVRYLCESSDYFFMNSNEANGLFDTNEIDLPRQRPTIFVTDGENGATVYDSGNIFEVPATRITELDPTGAGDTFCGTTLAHILHGMPVQEAAEIACDVASKNVEQVGPAFLISAFTKQSKFRRFRDL
ncbi:MAG TPA: carbohydrate kinase family protein [Drouetiella sp.]|jgi:sugar/nucleoside kinase (ribokinase family)